MWRQLFYILGKLHFRSAETLLFIEGRSTLSTQLRLSMFKGDAILKGKSRIISGSELSETNNEPTFGFLTPKKSKNYFLSETIINMSQLLDYTGKIDKKSIKKIENLFLAQIYLKRIMSQFLDYTKK